MQSQQLKALAHAWSNIDRDELEIAGVMVPGQVGGGDWHRFNDDPMGFIIKLPADKLQSLAVLIASKA